MTPFRIDNAAGTQICSLDNSGNLSSAATMQAPTFVASSSLSVNYATASDTVEIKNKSSMTNILNGRNNSGTSVFSVDNSGTCSTYSLIITCPTGSSIILPTSYTSTPVSSCLGYKFENYAQVGNMTLPQATWYNVCSITLPPEFG